MIIQGKDMTQLCSEVLYLTRKDVEDINLPMRVIIDLLETAFIEKSHGRCEMPPKIGIHTQENAFIHAMPCWIQKMQTAGLKWVSGYPGNPQKGLPYIAGLLILNDTETGFPLAIMDCSWITAMRTGAVSGLACRHLANPESEVLGILGCGVQGRTNLEAILCTCKRLKRIYAFDIFPEVTEKFITEQSEKFGIEMIGVDHPKKAVVESDIIVTAGPIVHNPEGVIEKDWLKKGITLTPVDFDCMFKPGALEKSVDLYFTDDTGQYDTFKSMGYFPHGPASPPELADLITGKKTGRTDNTEKIVAMNIGMALDDMATAIRIYNNAIEAGLGRILPL